ncbi:MAG: CPBP family intramembrane glutamic endopeptidase [Caldilineaceae bacterium]
MSTLAVSPKPTLFASLKLLVVRHPFIAYFTIAYGCTWLLMLPLLLSNDGFGVLPFTPPMVMDGVLGLVATLAGPSLAAILVTAALEGKTGVRQFLRRYRQWRADIRAYLIILVGYPLFFAALDSVFVGPTTLWHELMAHWSTWFTTYWPMILLFPGIIHWGEEPGWRGFAQWRMQTAYGALRASLIVGLLHGAWHLPAFLLSGGPMAMGPFDPQWFVVDVLDIMLSAVVLACIFNLARGSILVAILSHAGYTAADNWVGGLIPKALVDQVNLWHWRYTQLGFLVVIALVVIVLTKGRLGYQPTEQTQQNGKP